jgi:Tat protein secretion system quality control protein TatD with DNase activity
MERESCNIPLVDGHAHLEELEDLTESLQDARAAGVCGIIAVGMNAESNQKVLKIAEGNRGYVYPAVGYHP